jgi:hypothetical protein
MLCGYGIEAGRGRGEKFTATHEGLPRSRCRSGDCHRYGKTVIMTAPWLGTWVE